MKILPGDSTRIADESSLLIMDIVVELEDGSIANVEMQKIGYLFIPLDIFKKSKQNRNIGNRRDAWLTLFTSDEPEEIIEIIEKYPEFRVIYEEGYEICLNVERVMEMFSKELYQLDRNTVQYMIDEMQDTIDAQKDELDKKNQMIEELRRKNEELLAQNIATQ